ncbi:MAG: hypothetical protein KUG82_01975 [Pseudomonadales bacterium]|nr:hypothetical protein [Pseudomonadales bacterium]
MNKFCLYVFLSLLTFDASAYERNVEFSMEYYWSNWKPVGIEGVNYKTTGLNAWVATIDFSPMIENFKLDVNIFPKIQYIWTPEDKIEQSSLLSSVISLKGKNAMEQLSIDWPFVNIDTGEGLRITYDKAGFLALLTTEENRTYTNFDGQQSTIAQSQYLSQLVEFEKGRIMYEFPSDNRENVFFGFGAYQIEYRKPYSPFREGISVSDEIFDARFKSEGVSVLVKKYFINEKETKFYISFILSAGEANIDFTDNQNIEQYLETLEVPTFFGLNSNIFLQHNFNRFTSLVMNIGYDSYDFAKGKTDANGNISSDKIHGVLDINLDNVFFFHIGIVTAI